MFSLIAALLFGLAPAWASPRHNLAVGLQQGGRSTTTGRIRTILLATQVILCTVLLSGESLLIWALDESRHADTGFAANQIMVLNPDLDSGGVAETQTAAVADTLKQRINTLPGVVGVTHAVVVPLGRRTDTVGTDLPDTHQPVSFNFNRAGANFFELMGIPIVAGCNFTAADEERKDVIIVNETLAKRVWPNQNPIGKALMGDRVVIGVARDHHLRELGPSAESAAIIAAKPSRDSQLLIRYSAGVDTRAAALQCAQATRNIDGRMMMGSAEPIASLLAVRASQPY